MLTLTCLKFRYSLCEMNKELLNFLLISGSIQGVLFVLFTTIVKKKIDKPILFLSGTVVFISLNNLQAWIIEKGFLVPITFIKHLEVPWHMLIVPFFYSFLIYYLRLDKKFKPFVRLTLFIFSFEVLIMAVIILSIYNSSIEISILERYIQGIEMLNASYTIFIFIKAALIIFTPKDDYNYMLSFDNMRWLKQFIIFGVLVIVLWIVGIVLNAYVTDNSERFTYYPLRLSSSLLIYWIGYQGLIRFNLTEERISLRREISKERIQIEKVDPITTGYTTAKETFSIVDNYILNNQLFTNPLLSLNSISDMLKINKNVLSKSINSCSELNFSDYINKFRVKFAKEMLTDKKYEIYTITSIGLECGFNSKSTFYASFKKFTQMTPLEYKRQKTII
jgi:AraC-like DNA-binding protein